MKRFRHLNGGPNRADRSERKGDRSAVNAVMLLLPVLAGVGFVVLALVKPPLAFKALKGGGMTFLKALPLIVTGFAIAGLLQVIELRVLIHGWLGSQTGLKGVLMGTLLGALTPGPVYLVLPMAGGLLKGGAGAGAIVAYLTSWDLCSVRRLAIDLTLIDSKVVLVKFALSILLSLAAGLIAGIILSKTAFS